MENNYQEFENYLYGLEETQRSIEEHLKNMSYFDQWCEYNVITEKEFLEIGAIREYVKYMQQKPLQIGTQNIRLNTLSKYYDFLKEEAIIHRNPIKHFRVRKQKKKVVRNNFSEQELDQLYTAFVTMTDAKIQRQSYRTDALMRYKLIVSLVIYQGLHTGELDKLVVADLNLDKSTIIIQGTSRAKERVLQLHQSQILPFYKYVNSLPSHQVKLFAIQVQKGFDRLLQELRGLNPMVQNLSHIRGSVLINWIAKHGKRQAQYMIGHKFVSSTEKYEVQDVSELSELMESTHLFG